MTHRDLPYLQHVLDACADVGEFVAEGRRAVEESKLVLNGVVRQLSVIGEAVKRISPETKLLAPNVPWKQIAGMRDRLVHDYFEIIPEQVWNAVFEDIPKLKTEIETLLKLLDI
ncbi:MAG: DUF86 domain-containing protein [Burkholderiales bacterium]